LKKKWIYVVIALVVITALVTGVAVYYNAQNNYVGKVGTQKITTSEYNFFLNYSKIRFETNYNIFSATQKEKEDFWNQKYEDGKTFKVWLKDSVLNQVRDFKIQMAKAKDAKLTLSKDEIKNTKSVGDQQLSAIASYLNQKADTEAQKRKVVKEQFKVSLPQYYDYMENIALVNKLVESEQKKITLTDTEIQDYYNKNKNNFDTVTVRHILIKTTDENENALSDEKKKEMKKKAEDILAKVNAGEDMIALVEQYSEDTEEAKKTNKGEYSFKYNEGYSQAFKDWAFNTAKAVGETGIVESEFGYHVMKLEKRTGMAEAKESVTSELKNSKYEKVVEGWAKEGRFKLTRNDKVLDAVKVV